MRKGDTCGEGLHSGTLARTIALALATGVLALGVRALIASGWGPALRSVADRVLPYAETIMWAPAPEPGSCTSSYPDATGAGENYVYLVEAADEKGRTRELQLIFFGRPSDGAGWLEIEARGGSGVRYLPCDEDDVPDAALATLNESDDRPV